MASQVRDLHGASRAVAYLTIAAAPFVFVTSLTTHQTTTVMIAVSLICLLLAGLGVGCWCKPQLFPEAFWLLAPTVCAGLNTVLNVITHDASTGAQLFYLWPVLFAANFLSRRIIYLSVAVVSAGGAATIFGVSGRQATSDWAALVLAMTMIAVVVYTLRARADKLLQVLESQALADPLTGLANRRSFDNDLARQFARAQRKQNALALLTIDLDHFKTINDTWGHAVGDQALQAVATAMDEVAREDDVTARLGGDEFVMLLRADRTGAIRVSEALRRAVGQVTTLPGGPPGLSIGIAVLPDDASTVEGLVAASDAALYEAKTGGRGRTSDRSRHAANAR
jgi:diguanylate cyclase (GGDEF)-like protein